MDQGDLGKSFLKGSRRGNTIAILTSGGDCQGMNAALRSSVRAALFLGCQVFLIKEGFRGLVDGGSHYVLANWKLVNAGMLSMGGTVIGSASITEFKEKAGRLKAANNLIKFGINHLICIGGDGSMLAVNSFHRDWKSLLEELVETNKISAEKAIVFYNLNMVGLVASVDNDFCGTDYTIGCDSALHRILEVLDNVTSSSTSNSRRCFILEVTGKNCGFLAKTAALASEADWIFIPEWPPDKGWEDRLCAKIGQINELYQCKKNVIIISEGAKDREGNTITAREVKEVITKRLKLDTQITVMGRVQREGCPSAYDRILATRLGAEAVIAVIDSQKDFIPQAIGTDGTQIVRVPLAEAVQRTKSFKTAVAENDFATALKVRGRIFQSNLASYIMLSSVVPPTKQTVMKAKAKNLVIAFMCMGKPTCGMNAAIRAFVRAALSNEYTVCGIQNGFEGLLDSRVDYFKWEDVAGWTDIGGSNVGCSRALLEQFDIDKVTLQMKKYKISALLLLGGYEAYHNAWSMFESRKIHAEFCIPITVIPITACNSVPGTDVAVGSDSALNRAVEMCDQLRESVIGSKCGVFICEILGGYCGYLASMCALATGADAAYIFEDPYGIHELMADVYSMGIKIKNGERFGLILKSSESHELYNIDFIHRLFAREGRSSSEGRSSFPANYNVFGETQMGGRPSPRDRLGGITMGVLCAEKLIAQLMECTSVTGVVNATGSDTCTMLGHQKRTTSFEPISEIRKRYDLTNRIPKENWWMKMRPLIRIMARHDAVYRSESIESKARDVDDKIISDKTK